LLGLTVAAWDGQSDPPMRTGSRVHGGVPRNVYQASDGRWIVLSGTTDAQVRRVLAVIGADTEAARERYGTSAARLAVADELDALVADWIRARPRNEVIEAFRQARVPVSPVNDLADLADDPHVRDRESLIRVPDGAEGETLVAAPFPRLSATPGRIEQLGERARVAAVEVLSEWEQGR
jgi:crotonobetainyl-CoA:carnitine CoA-transferase CaiB-like acyl-CoA transferase